MSPPIEKMELRPFGEDYMFPAWMACVVSIAQNPGAVKQFKEETGHDLESVMKARGMAALIDNATGHAETVLAAWCDWVTLNVWGVEE